MSCLPLVLQPPIKTTPMYLNAICKNIGIIASIQVINIYNYSNAGDHIIEQMQYLTFSSHSR